MTTDIVVREAEFTDLENLVQLLFELFSIEKDFHFSEQNQRKGLELMLDDSEERKVWVACIDEKVIGMCTAQKLISTAEGGEVALIEDMVVSKKFHGMGVGNKLLGKVEKWAEINSISRLQLLADKFNSPALDFYKKLNWGETRMICLRKTKPFS